jgi:uncharacterized phiE125 gp8 family phage protein
MTVVVLTPPPPIVDLAKAKTHLRIDHNDEDGLVAAYLAAAVGHIDGPQGWLGRCIGPQSLELRRASFGAGPIALYGPVIDVEEVQYADPDGASQTLDLASLTLSGDWLFPAYGESWPITRDHPGSVAIRYRAGYAARPLGDPLAPAIPHPIIAAVLLMTGDLYSHRETSVVGAVSAEVKMSTTVANLLAPFRVWSF